MSWPRSRQYSKEFVDDRALPERVSAPSPLRSMRLRVPSKRADHGVAIEPPGSKTHLNLVIVGLRILLAQLGLSQGMHHFNGFKDSRQLFAQWNLALNFEEELQSHRI